MFPLSAELFRKRDAKHSGQSSRCLLISQSSAHGLSMYPLILTNLTAPGTKTRAQSLLGRIPLGADPELDSLAMHLANRAHKARASRTVAQCKESWKEFLAWAEQKQAAGTDIHEVMPEVVAMYLTRVFMTVEADDVSHGRLAPACVEIACHFFFTGRSSPTDQPTCNSSGI